MFRQVISDRLQKLSLLWTSTSFKFLTLVTKTFVSSPHISRKLDSLKTLSRSLKRQSRIFHLGCNWKSSRSPWRSRQCEASLQLRHSLTCAGTGSRQRVVCSAVETIQWRSLALHTQVGKCTNKIAIECWYLVGHIIGWMPSSPSSWKDVIVCLLLSRSFSITQVVCLVYTRTM